MYLSHRVKKKNFLNLANRSRISRGLKAIDQSILYTTEHFQKTKGPFRQSNTMALVFFAPKSPPKLQEDDNIVTHHQRAFKKGILTDDAKRMTLRDQGSISSFQEMIRPTYVLELALVNFIL